MDKKKSKSKDNVARMLKCIDDGNNVDAYKLLEKIVHNKVADKVSNAMKDM